MWNLKHDTNEPTYKIEIVIDVQNRLVLSKGEEREVGWMGSFGLLDAKFTFRKDKQ